MMKARSALFLCLALCGYAHAADNAPTVAATNNFWKLGNPHAWTVPTATGYAPIDDIAAPPVALEDIGEYQTWLTRMPPRAFAVNGKNGFGIGYGAKAMQTALDNCESVTQSKCWLYAVDDHVVYADKEALRVGLGQASLPESKLVAPVVPAVAVSARPAGGA